MFRIYRATRVCYWAINTFGILLSVIVFAGCGGGSGTPGGTAVGGQDQTLTFGNLTTRVAAATQPPVTFSNNLVTVTGIAGGDVTSLVQQDSAPKLSETQILISERVSRAGTALVSIDPAGTRETPLAGTDAVSNPAWSLDGSKLAFAQRDSTGHSHIVTSNADGSGVAQLTNDALDDIEPSWSPDAKKIVFSRADRAGHSHLAIMSADGTGVQQITDGVLDDVFPVFSPIGNFIAFQRNQVGSPDQLFFINPDGSGLRPLLTSPFNDASPSFAPDGKTIAFSRSDFDRLGHIFVFNVANNQVTQLTASAGVSDTTPVWSPDGKELAFVRNQGPLLLTTMKADGSEQTGISSNILLDRPAWQPFISRRTLLGSNGLLGNTAAGFLFAQSSGALRSVVSFDTLGGLRQTARVTPEAGNTAGAPKIVFDINSDGLKSLAFTQGPDFRRTTILGGPGPTSSSTGAVVDFDPSDGSVQAILPFTGNRSAGSKAGASLEGGQLVYRRSFAGVWDRSGKNIAPNGASEVRLDARTGKIVLVR